MRARWLLARSWRRLRAARRPGARAGAPPLRLHVGSGRERIEGWVNVDLEPYPEVDVVADVTRGLDFRDVDAIFAEHFLEHLELSAALDFLLEAHRILRPEGWLRLSTPNLDWVWASHYALEPRGDGRVPYALRLNRAFYAWGHRFLWNRELLELALLAAGFGEIAFCRYGESRNPALAGLERHETFPEGPELSHVLIAEATRGERRPALLAELRQMIRHELPPPENG